MQVQRIRDFAQDQRAHRDFTVLEKMALAVDDGLRHPQNGVEPLLDVLDEPARFLQLAGELLMPGVAVAEHFPHIAIQSRFSGRKSDRASELVQLSPEASMDGPQLTVMRPDGHLRSMEEIEADLIRLAIGHYRGRMTEVARRLGIGRSTLYRKLGELGIDTSS